MICFLKEQLVSNFSETNRVVELIRSVSSEGKLQGYLAYYGYWWGGTTDIDFLITSYTANKNVLTLDFADGGYSNYQFSIDITTPAEVELLDDALVIWHAEALSVYCRSDKKYTVPNPDFFTKYKLIEGEIYYADSELSSYYKPVANQPAFEIAWHVPLGAEKVCYRERGKVRVPPGPSYQ